MQEESKLQEKVQEFEVTDTYDGSRLDKFLSAIYSGQSRTFFQKLIKAGNSILYFIRFPESQSVFHRLLHFYLYKHFRYDSVR